MMGPGVMSGPINHAMTRRDVVTPTDYTARTEHWQQANRELPRDDTRSAAQRMGEVPRVQLAGSTGAAQLAAVLDAHAELHARVAQEIRELTEALGEAFSGVVDNTESLNDDMVQTFQQAAVRATSAEQATTTYTPPAAPDAPPAAPSADGAGSGEAPAAPAQPGADTSAGATPPATTPLPGTTPPTTVELS